MANPISNHYRLSKPILSPNISASNASLVTLYRYPIHCHTSRHHHHFLPISFSLPYKATKPKPPNATTAPPQHRPIPSHFVPSEPRKGADILIEALEQEGVTHVFAYPGGASMEIHQALTRSTSIKTILPRHEQGGVLAAIGLARASGRPGACVATSGPGATNLITGLADAMADSVPVVAITAQVSRQLMGTDAFQEVSVVEIARSITKHIFLVLNSNDIPRIVKEAFYIAQTGRPGPVLLDIPKDVQQETVLPNWVDSVNLPGYITCLPKPLQIETLEMVVDMILDAKRPVLYVGGGCIDSSVELRRFVELTGIPVASTLMGIGVFPCDNEEFYLGMLGMHGTMCANYAVHNSDLLLAFGVRFDVRVTGKLEAFASQAKIVHIDVDASELGKNKQPHLAIHSDSKQALLMMNKILLQRQQRRKFRPDFSKWRKELNDERSKHILKTKAVYYENDEISSEYAVSLLNKLTKGKAVITTSVGQHQMFTAQHYRFKSPRQLITSGGLGTPGYGLPAAIGAMVARPESLVVDIDGDGNFIMNVQELATVRAQNLPIKIIVLNNQHLGMVTQLEDMFYGANRADTYMGNPENKTGLFPDMVKLAEACEIPAERVTKKSELREAMERMLKTPGPYLLDVAVRQNEHVLPMIPSGGTIEDAITH